jgi:hypothetical protein
MLPPGLGIDLMVQYSSPDAKNPGRGATVFAVDNQGNRTPLTFEQAGLASAPTFAANAFEVRISRHIDPAIAPGLAAAVNSGRPRLRHVRSERCHRQVRGLV